MWVLMAPPGLKECSRVRSVQWVTVCLSISPVQKNTACLGDTSTSTQSSSVAAKEPTQLEIKNSEWSREDHPSTEASAEYSSFKKTQKENRFLREGNSHGRSISFSRSARSMKVWKVELKNDNVQSFNTRWDEAMKSR